MGRGRLIAVVLLAASATALSGEPLLAGPPGPHGAHWGRPHFHFRPRVLPPPWLISPYNMGPEYYGVPPSFYPEPPAPPYSSPAPSLAPAPPPSFSEGMAITVEKILRADQKEDDSRRSPLIERPKQAAEQLAACWTPPLPDRGETVEVTIRFAFNGQGGIIGAPRITYVKPGKAMSAGDVRESIVAAVKDCTPLRFSKSMAVSAPGYPLAVRFVGKRAED